MSMRVAGRDVRWDATLGSFSTRLRGRKGEQRRRKACLTEAPMAVEGIGLRRTGKTSIRYALCRRIEVYVFSFDCPRVSVFHVGEWVGSKKMQAVTLPRPSVDSLSHGEYRYPHLT
jgi:hypothetical protein